MCSPYQYWQYWRNTEDNDIGRFLRLFTDLPEDEIRRRESLQGSELNETKKVLATEATALCHGREAAEEAAETARRTFETGEFDINLPTVEIARDKLAGGMLVANLVQLAGLTASTGEARRLIQSGGVRLNDAVVTDPKASASLANLTAQGVLKVSIGRKKHALIKPV
jgi:tyrosyl-tRNA synthetase